MDLSEDALAVAREIGANLGLGGRAALRRGAWTAGLEEGGFDLVVANPPYVRTEELAALDPEVRDHEPRLALDGGEDGLRDYRVLGPEILRVLKPGGLFLVEIGDDQGAEVSALFHDAGAQGLGVLKDLCDKERVVTGRKKALGNL